MGKKDEAAAPAAAENIKVLVRCRPLNRKELEAGYKPCVDMNLAEGTVTVNHVVGAPDRWTFDAVVNNTFSQKDIFTQFIMPMVDSVLDGFNATVFAYGQSGSGKTHTMTGKYDDDELMGITPRSFRYVFEYIKKIQVTNPNRRYQLSCSYIELYNGKVRDLLAKEQVALNVKENKDKTFYVQGANFPIVKFPEDLIRLTEEGTERRQVTATELNSESSRSHSIFTLMVECIESGDDGDTRSVTSKFNLVDLAGSERQSKTGAQGDTLKEGCNINLSLSALGTVIDTIVKGKGHVPFRSSPLTMLLKDSLGGSSKTVMFANIGPSEHNLSETVSTLRFADRAKQIKNKPVVNMDGKDQKIQELTELVAQLKDKLKVLETGNMEQMEQELADLKEKYGELEIDLDNVKKGREADRLEATQARDALQQELSDLTKEREDMNLKILTLQQEVALADQACKDEKAQRDEIWRVVSQYWANLPAATAATETPNEGGLLIADIDQLMAKLRTLESSVPGEEHQKVQSELKRITAEAGNAQSAFEADLAALKSSEAAAKEECDALQRKLEKVKEKLDKEKEARRHLIETQTEILANNDAAAGGASKSNMDFATSGYITADNASAAAWMTEKHQLESAHVAKIQELEKVIERLAAGEAVPTAQEEAAAEASAVDVSSRSENSPSKSQGASGANEEVWKKLIADRDASIASLQQRLKEMTDALSGDAAAGASAPGAPVMVEQLKIIVRSKDDAIEDAKKEVARVEKQLEALTKKQKSKAAALVSTSSAGAGASTALHELSNIYEQQNLRWAEREASLQRQLQQVSKHRDALLLGVSSGDAALKPEVERLLKEIETLRQDQLESQKNHEKLVANEQELTSMKVHQLEIIEHAESTKAELKRSWQEESEMLQKKLQDVEAKSTGAEADLVATLKEAGGVDDKVAALIEELQSEKMKLATERNRAQQDLHHAMEELAVVRTGSSAPGTLGPDASTSPQRQPDLENDAAVAKLLCALPTDSEEVKALKESLQAAIAQAAPASATAVSGDQIMTPITSIRRRGSVAASANPQELIDLRSKVALLEDEKTELAGEIEQAKADTADALARLDHLKAEIARLHEEASQRTKDLATTKLALAEEENKHNELQAEFARAAKDNEASTTAVAAMEARLKEKTDQTNELRKLLEGQKQLLEATKSKVESLQKAVALGKDDLIERNKLHSQQLQDQEAASQRALNRRLEAQAEEHHKALARKDEEMHAYRKKMKKMEKELQKAQEAYDEKLCEYAELVGRMEDQKFDAMRNLKGEEQIVMEEAKEAVGDALKRAKEDQRRKKDQFASGATMSAVSGLIRTNNAAVGSASAAAKARHSRPSSSGPSTPNDESLDGTPQQPAPAPKPPTGPRPPTVVVGAERNVGGAGYNSMAMNRPPTAQATPQPAHVAGDADLYDF